MGIGSILIITAIGVFLCGFLLLLVNVAIKRRDAGAATPAFAG